jgi:hypothetical protein
MAARTLLARLGHVWMWPGIPLTEKRGAACVPVAADAARFWITRLHGPDAIDTYVLPCLHAAARKLSEGDEAGAQIALDASGLTRLSPDGLELMRAVAGSLGIALLDLPWRDGPRLWRTEVIDAHLPLFKDFAPGGSSAREGGRLRRIKASAGACGVTRRRTVYQWRRWGWRRGPTSAKEAGRRRERRAAGNS